MPALADEMPVLSVQVNHTLYLCMCDQLVPCDAAISSGLSPSLLDQDESGAGCLHLQLLPIMADDAKHLSRFDQLKAQLPPIHWKCPIDVNQLIDTASR